MTTDNQTDPSGIDAHTKGAKLDAEKLDLTLVPASTTTIIAAVMGYGVKKYTRDSWIAVPDAGKRYFAALLRHLNAYQRGENLDTETGLPHLDHALCNLSFLIALRDEINIDVGSWRIANKG